MKILERRDFLFLVLTDAFTKFADSMDNVIITLLVIHLTGSSMKTGIMLAITTLPGILFSILGGTLSDTKEPGRIISIMTACQAALLTAAAILFRTGKINFFILCAILFILEIFSRFYSPAFTAAAIKVVSKEHYKQAISSVTTIGSIMQMIGHALSATLVTVLGYMYALIINSLSYLLSSFFSTKVKTAVKREKAEVIKVKEIMRNSRMGLHYVRSNITVLSIIAVVSVMNYVLAWFDVALPFLITDYIKAPVESLGYVKAVSTFMFVVAGVIMAKKKTERDDDIVCVATAIIGGAIIAISFLLNIIYTDVLWGSAAFLEQLCLLF